MFNDTHASSDYDKENLFNNYFRSVFAKDSYVTSDLPNYLHRTNYIDNIEISEEEVFEAITSLNSNKAVGINPNILKYCASVLVQPIHHLFLLTLAHQSLPQDWKTHIISLVFKSGNKSAVNNYRPISLLCIMSKVLERMIINKISELIIDANPPNQFGFLRGQSCTQQLLFSIISMKQQLTTLKLMS